MACRSNCRFLIPLSVFNKRRIYAILDTYTVSYIETDGVVIILCSESVGGGESLSK